MHLDTMQNTIRCKIRLREGVATVRALIRHPMETGFRVDPETAQLVPAHYITHIDCTHNGRRVLHCDWSRAVSKNPYLSFMFEGARPGDTLHLGWVDNLGQQDRLEVLVPPAP